MIGPVHASAVSGAMVQVLAQSASRTVDPPREEPPGLLVPFVALVAVIALVVAITAFVRAGRADR
jgi:ABC-type Fe3+-siderophore transport system permease subunit